MGKYISTLCIVWLLTINTSYAKTLSNNPVFNENMAQEISQLFLSFKLVITEQQTLINNPNIADKGLTPEVVEQKALENYSQLAGKPFAYSDNDILMQAQRDLFSSARKVMEQAQPLINAPNIGFKGFITAIFTRQLAKEYSSRSPQVSFKFTAPQDLLRSKRNSPDVWESAVFSEYFRNQSWPVGQTFSQQADAEFRWMMPIYHDAGCLSCHGGPAGGKDIVGFTMEGAQLGDLAGAFSIRIQ